jgi:hypothetical protein
VRKVLQRVLDHREHERGKLKERTLRRMALQEKAGIVMSSEQEVYMCARENMRDMYICSLSFICVCVCVCVNVRVSASNSSAHTSTRTYLQFQAYVHVMIPIYILTFTNFKHLKTRSTT